MSVIHYCDVCGEETKNVTYSDGEIVVHPTVNIKKGLLPPSADKGGIYYIVTKDGLSVDYDICIDCMINILKESK